MPRLRLTAPASVAAVLVAAALGAGIGCSSSPEPAVGRALPDGLSVSIVQTRADIAKRQLEIAVSNESAETLIVSAAEFASTQFSETAVWQKRETSISPGRTVNLPVLLTDPDCSVENPVAEVRLDLRLGSDDPIAVAVRPDDELDRLPALQAEDCLSVAVMQVAELVVMDPPRIRTIGVTSVVDVDIAVLPTGSGGSFSIGEALGTTLLAPAEPGSGAMIPTSPVARTIDGDDVDSTLTLTFVPNRCDAHAIAEDKRGTIIPLRVTTDDGTSGVVSLASPPEAKSALIDYISETCASR